MATINILLVDDHKLFRQVLVPALETYKIKTIAEAENGEVALELLKCIDPDVVVLDIEMPIMNGAVFLQKAKKIYPELKIIVLTGQAHETLNHCLKQNGASAILSKYADLNILTETIRSVHKNSYVHNSSTLKIHCTNKLKISRREAEIAPLICQGLSTKQIAQKLCITDKTVEAHKRNLFAKTNSVNVTQLTVFLIAEGLNFLF